MKAKNTHPSPVDQILKMCRAQLISKQMKSTLPDGIGDCLSAVERLNTQVYEQLMRVHVCVDICLPLCT